MARTAESHRDFQDGGLATVAIEATADECGEDADVARLSTKNED